MQDSLTEYDVEPFNINVLSLERIFVEKLFAINAPFNNKKLRTRTRHYYDIYMLLKTNEIKALINDKNKINLIIKDIADISSVYFPDEEISNFDNLLSCPAFNLRYQRS